MSSAPDLVAPADWRELPPPSLWGPVEHVTVAVPHRADRVVRPIVLVLTAAAAALGLALII